MTLFDLKKIENPHRKGNDLNRRKSTEVKEDNTFDINKGQMKGFLHCALFIYAIDISPSHFSYCSICMPLLSRLYCKLPVPMLACSSLCFLRIVIEP